MMLSSKASLAGVLLLVAGLASAGRAYEPKAALSQPPLELADMGEMGSMGGSGGGMGAMQQPSQGGGAHAAPAPGHGAHQPGSSNPQMEQHMEEMHRHMEEMHPPSGQPSPKPDMHM